MNATYKRWPHDVRNCLRERTMNKQTKKEEIWHKFNVWLAVVVFVLRSIENDDPFEYSSFYLKNKNERTEDVHEI